MKKKMCLAMPELALSKEVLESIKKEVPEIKKNYGGKEEVFKYRAYVTAIAKDGILKASIWETAYLRKGATIPSYNIYVDKENWDYITHDPSADKWLTASIENLNYHGSYWSGRPYTVDEAQKVFKEYFGSETGDVDDIRIFQKEVRNIRLQRSYERELAPWKKEMALIPKPPKGFSDWADIESVGQHILFYQNGKKPATEGYATCCRKSVPIKGKATYNATGNCACCGKPLTFKSLGRSGKHFASNFKVTYLFQKFSEGIVLREFYVARRYQKEISSYKTEVAIEECRRVLYYSNGTTHVYYYGTYRDKSAQWMPAENVRTYRGYSTYNGYLYPYTMRDAKPLLDRTGLLEVLKTRPYMDPELYLGKQKDRPYWEALAKAGLTNLVIEEYDAGYFSSETKLKFDSSKKGLAKQLGIDNARLKRLRENNGDNLFLKWLEQEKLENTIFEDKTIQFFDRNKIYPKELEFIRDRMALTAIANYIAKQSKLCNRKPKEIISTWNDYLAMASRLKMDVKKEIFFKPKNLKEAHDEAVSLTGGKEIVKRAGEIEKKFPDIDAICQSIKEKYEFRDEKYQIIVPEKIEDILYEGQVLKHCLDRSDIYFERIQNRESYIVFLRKATEPDVPYYTLEIEPNGVARQKRTTGDCQNKDFDEAKEFIRKWQIAIQKNLTDSDRALAQTSAKLRKEEFKELRKNQNKIRNGHLAGKLLVDVLEADLMELIA